MYGLWFSSKFAKNSSKLDKVDKTRCTWPFQPKNRYDVTLANRRAPGVWFVLRFRIYLFLAQKWPRITCFGENINLLFAFVSRAIAWKPSCFPTQYSDFLNVFRILLEHFLWPRTALYRWLNVKNNNIVTTWDYVCTSTAAVQKAGRRPTWNNFWYATYYVRTYMVFIHCAPLVRNQSNTNQPRTNPQPQRVPW